MVDLNPRRSEIVLKINIKGFPGSPEVKNPPCNARDIVWSGGDPGLGGILVWEAILVWEGILVWEDLSCRRAAKPVCHNYWAHALEPMSCNYWARVPQLLKLALLEPVLHNVRNHCSEELQRSVVFTHCKERKPVCGMKTQRSQNKINR